MIVDSMRLRTALLLTAVAAAVAATAGQRTAAQAQPHASPRNVVIFVADGLRRGSVNAADMPALTALRAEGVDFENSYSVFPTFTMVNASAIATGHYPGDTGVFTNNVWLRRPTFDTGNFNAAAGTPVPFLENDRVLADLDDAAGGDFVEAETLLAAARAHGYSTAAIGKLGPAAMQDVAAIAPSGRTFPAALPGIIVDDSTGPSGIPLSEDIRRRLDREGLTPEAPARNNGYAPGSAFDNGALGDRTHPGTVMPNTVQQRWFADVATRVVLPAFEGADRPFAVLYWSRDPDGTQHNQGDSLGQLAPGINGPTSRRAVQNADRNLSQILAWLDAHPAIKANTDVFVTSDHGFATIGRNEIDRQGHRSSSESAQHTYVDRSGRVDTEKGTLPAGCLAIDLAVGFQMNLFDPDVRVVDGGSDVYRRVRITSSDAWEHPVAGNGLLGPAAEKLDGSDARIVVVTAKGGSDLVYVPSADPALVRGVAERVLALDYVGAVFVDDRFGDVAGTLPMSVLGLVGNARLPQPALVVAFKTFYLDPADLQTAIQISDTTFQEGQGMHGGFGRDSTLNTMAALGPDFKRGFVDRQPASNTDIAPTLARVMGFDLRSAGALGGRILSEALNGEPDPPASCCATRFLASEPANGARTILYFQEMPGHVRYNATACRVPVDRQMFPAPTPCRE